MHEQKVNCNSIFKFYDKIHCFFKRINPKWYTVIITLFAIPYHMFAIYKDTLANVKDANNKEKKQMQIVRDVKNLIMSLIDTILAICAIFLTGPLILIIGAIKKFLDCSLDVGLAVYNRYFGYGRNEATLINHLSENIKMKTQQDISLPRDQEKTLTKHINILHKLNANLADKVHNCLLSTLALVGVVLTFTPAASIGTMILTGISTYLFIDYLGLNPLHLLIKGISNQVDKPFFSDYEKEIVKDLSNVDNVANKTNKRMNTIWHNSTTGLLNVFRKDISKIAQYMARAPFFIHSENESSKCIKQDSYKMPVSSQTQDAHRLTPSR